MANISMTLRLDKQVVREAVKILDQKDVLLDEELASEIKKFTERLVFLFGHEEQVVIVRLK